MSVLVCQKADGEAASAKLNTLTHAYYVGILKAYGMHPLSTMGRTWAVETAVAFV